MSKKEIIAKLKSLGVEFDENLSATELKVILKNAEEVKPPVEDKEPIKEEDKKDDIITDKEEVKETVKATKENTYEELLVMCQDYKVMPDFTNIDFNGRYIVKADKKEFDTCYEAAVWNLHLNLQK